MSKFVDISDVEICGKIDSTCVEIVNTVMNYTRILESSIVRASGRGSIIFEEARDKMTEMFRDIELLGRKKNYIDFLNKYRFNANGKEEIINLGKITKYCMGESDKVYEAEVAKINDRNSFQDFIIDEYLISRKANEEYMRIYDEKSYTRTHIKEIRCDKVNEIDILGLKFWIMHTFGIQSYLIRQALEALCYGRVENKLFKVKNNKAYIRGYDKYDALEIFNIAFVFSEAVNLLYDNKTEDDDATLEEDESRIKKVIQEAGNRDRLEKFIEDSAKGRFSDLVNITNKSEIEEIFRKGKTDNTRYGGLDAGNRIYDYFHNIEIKDRDISKAVDIIKNFEQGSTLKKMGSGENVSCPLGYCMNSRHKGAVDGKTLNCHQCIGKQCRLFLMNKFNEDAVRKSNLDGVKVSREVFEYFKDMFGALIGACHGTECKEESAKIISDAYTVEISKVLNGKIINKKSIDDSIKSYILSNNINITFEEIVDIAKETKKQRGITDIAYERYEKEREEA